jgi:drug/metabolite transporter (DMT)-like permease
MQAPWTVLLGFVLLGESVSLREAIATAVILLGVMATSAPSLPRFRAERRERVEA